MKLGLGFGLDEMPWAARAWLYIIWVLLISLLVTFIVTAVTSLQQDASAMVESLFATFLDLFKVAVGGLLGSFGAMMRKPPTTGG